MFPVLSEKLRKITASTLVGVMVFSLSSPLAFGLAPTFIASQTVANLTPDATQSAITATTQANVVGTEVKASKTINLSAIPSGTLTVGTCVVNISNGGVTELDCTGGAYIKNNGGATNLTIAANLASLTNLTDAAHGALTASVSGSSVTFRTSGTETSATNLTLTNAATNITTTSTITGVIGTPSIAQINTITIGGTVEVGDTFTANLPGPVTASFTAVSTSASDVATGLNAAIQGSAGYASQAFTSSVAGSVVTLTAKVAGTGFTQTSGTTNKAAVAQVVTFTPTDPAAGSNYKITINGTDYDYLVVGAETVAQVVAALQPLVDANPAVTCSQDTTKITCIADVAGVAFTFSGSVILDNTGPSLSLPSNITQEATSPAGNVVTYVATSTDANPASPIVNCTPASGSTFPITTTTVNCSATDTAGNTSNGSFTITVQDTTAPVITLVGGAVNLTVGGSAYVEQGATVFDVVDTGLAAVIDSSAINPALPGSYIVTYNVTDTHGNVATTVNRVVNVSDVTGPAFFGIPADIVVEQIGTASAVVNYTAPTAIDDVDGAVAVLCGPLSGSLFSYGTTAVLCSAQDSAVAPGPNVSNTSFNITLQDTVFPTLTNVSIASNNANTTLAKSGDTITVSFTTSEPVNLPTATIAGKTATVTNTGGNNYTATYTLTSTETQGTAAVTIDFEDVAGNDGTQVTATTDASSVLIDTVGPVISDINSAVLFPAGLAITWTTDESTDSQVEYGLTNAYGTASTLDTSLVTAHTVNIHGLTSPETYFFQVITTDAAGNTTTAVSSGGGTATTSIGGSGGISNGSGGTSFEVTPIVPTPTETPSNPETPTTPTNTPEPNPTSNPETPTTPETTNTTGDNSELISTSFPNDTGSNAGGTGTTTGGTTTGGTGGGTTGRRTGGTTGGTFTPTSATLDAGGGVTPEEPTVEPAPTEIPQDIGGGVVPEEESHTLAWTLLGLVVLLNFAWFYTRKNSVPTR